MNREHDNNEDIIVTSTNSELETVYLLLHLSQHNANEIK